jgi:MOSC domain-containing protein YiiM
MMMKVLSVSKSSDHHFSKTPCDRITLIAGQGVAGDCHAGETVKHRSRVRVDPTQPNLRQVHLIHEELFDELRAQDHLISAGELGENITTQGIDLLSLPCGTRLMLGREAVIELTGLRNPCQQIEDFRAGLLSKVLHKRSDGTLIRKTGVMAVVLRSGSVFPGDTIEVSYPPLPHAALERV